MKCYNKQRQQIPCKKGQARTRTWEDGKWKLVDVPGDGFPGQPTGEMRQLPQEPTVADMARNFAKATAEWTAAGFPVVDRNEYNRRLAFCRGCPLWDENARFGYGKCKHKQCGCGKGKMWMTTQACPDKLW